MAATGLLHGTAHGAHQRPTTRSVLVRRSVLPCIAAAAPADAALQSMAAYRWWDRPHRSQHAWHAAPWPSHGPSRGHRQLRCDRRCCRTTAVALIAMAAWSSFSSSMAPCYHRHCRCRRRHASPSSLPPCLPSSIHASIRPPSRTQPARTTLVDRAHPRRRPLGRLRGRHSAATHRRAWRRRARRPPTAPLRDNRAARRQMPPQPHRPPARDRPSCYASAWRARERPR